MKRAIPLILLLPLLAVPVGDASARPRLRGHFERVIVDTDASLWQVRSFPEGRIYACGADGWFVQSPDGGKTWDATQIREGLSLRVMCWVDERTGYLVGRRHGRNFLLTTSTGGEAFDQRPLDLDFPVRGMAFTDRRHGWFVAGSTSKWDGAWRYTKNGGSTLEAVDSVEYAIPARALLSITTTGEKGLVAVGSHVEAGFVGEAARSVLYQHRKGSVLRSADGGRTWKAIDAGNPAGTTLTDVDFADETHGWVVGDGGFLARTADGGVTWSVVESGTKERLNAVDAVAADVMYAVGENGIAIGTNNGGEKIVPLPTGTRQPLRDCSFTGEQGGFAVGRGGVCLRFVRDY